MITKTDPIESLNLRICESGNRGIRNQPIRESPNQRITQSSLASPQFLLSPVPGEGQSNPQLAPKVAGD